MEEKWLRTEENISGMFNRISRTYDILNDILSLGMQRRWKKLAIQELSLEPGSRLLDICSGTADLAILAAERLGGTGSVTGLDFSAEMLEAGRHKVRDHHLEKMVSFVQGNAEKLPFADGSFTGATVGFGLRNIEDRERALSEVYRVLKKDGRFVCLEFSHSDNRYAAFFYNLYTRLIVPVAGGIISGDRLAYAYLPDSIAAFYTAQELKKLLEKTGFKDIAVRRLMFGVVAIHSGVK